MKQSISGLLAVILACSLLAILPTGLYADPLAVSLPGFGWYLPARDCPTATTDVDTKTVTVMGIFVHNTAASAINLEVFDKQGTPVPLISNMGTANQIPSGAVVVFNLSPGYVMTNGWTIKASAAGLKISATGKYQ